MKSFTFFFRKTSESRYLPVWLFLLLFSWLAADLSSTARMMVLDKAWTIQPSAEVKATGSEISQPGFKTQRWNRASVPGTVMANLRRNGQYPNLYFGRTLEQINTDPFKNPWWYRCEFDISPKDPLTAAQLILEGINYRAEVWLNGQPLSNSLEGAFAIHKLEVGSFLKPGRNALAVKVFPPQKGDLTIGFVDWNPAAPDHNLGLWRSVQLRLQDAVSMDNIFVQSRVDPSKPSHADLFIGLDLINHTQLTQSGDISLEVDTIRLRLPYQLPAGERRHFVLTPSSHPALAIDKARLWWPHQFGDPHLYTLHASISDGKHQLDHNSIRFGIREISDYTNDQGHRGYIINGQKILIRGAAWVDDMLLDDSDARVEAQMRYFRHMNLNTLRLEGFWGNSQKLYQMADELGLLLMVGLSCHWEWEAYCGRPEDEFISVRGPDDIALHAREYADQVLWLRHHPSILTWVLGSDKLPSPAFESELRRLINAADPDRPILAACKYRVIEGEPTPASPSSYLISSISGPTRVKMLGPYQWVPPIYWTTDRQFGGAYGFNTETGPGPQVPPLESIKRMITPEKLWPINSEWEYHGAQNEFRKLTTYEEAIGKRYGSAHSLEEFTRKAQMLNYESMRPMFEAFSTGRPAATGVIQWMGNSAWPKMVWQLFDYFLMPNGAFYGARKGCQALNLVYHYGEKNIWVVNETLRDRKDLRAQMIILGPEGTEIERYNIAAPVSANSARVLLDFNTPKHPLYFLSLRLQDNQGLPVADNFYWLSAKPDILDTEKSRWYVTPTKEQADYTSLRHLPRVTVQVSHRIDNLPKGLRRLHVQLENKGESLAFFMEMGLENTKTKLSVLPIFWSDNYISLLPGEKREYFADFAAQDLEGAKARLFLLGPNADVVNVDPSL